MAPTALLMSDGQTPCQLVAPKLSSQILLVRHRKIFLSAFNLSSQGLQSICKCVRTARKPKCVDALVSYPFGQGKKKKKKKLKLIKCSERFHNFGKKKKKWLSKKKKKNRSFWLAQLRPATIPTTFTSSWILFLGLSPACIVDSILSRFFRHFPQKKFFFFFCLLLFICASRFFFSLTFLSLSYIILNHFCGGGLLLEFEF